MTYLATEILLYLLSAAVIGLIMGWLIAGGGQRRKLKAMRTDLASALEAEKSAHHDTKIALDGSEVRARKAIELVKAEQQKSILALQETVEAERRKTSDAEAMLRQMRLDMDEALMEAQHADRKAIDDAMRAADVEKAAAAEAFARESQSQAQIEELRLLIGAEKRTAEKARLELEQARADMLGQLAAERAAHQKAKLALDDIRSTLAKTFGADVIGVMATNEAGAQPAQQPGSTNTPSPEPGYMGLTTTDGLDVGGSGSLSNGRDASDGSREDLGYMGLMATDSLDVGEASEEDRADAEAGAGDESPGKESPYHDDDDDDDADSYMGLETTPSPDAGRVDNHPDPKPTDGKGGDSEGLSLSTTTDPGSDQVKGLDVADVVEIIETTSSTSPDAIDFRPETIDPIAFDGPSVLYDQRPEKVDDFQAIDGIDAEIEDRLYQRGCYHYGQLSSLITTHVGWLADAIGISEEQIKDEHWAEQAEALQAEASSDKPRQAFIKSGSAGRGGMTTSMDSD